MLFSFEEAISLAPLDNSEPKSARSIFQPRGLQVPVVMLALV
jgi:hypothetical protein